MMDAGCLPLAPPAGQHSSQRASYNIAPASCNGSRGSSSTWQWPGMQPASVGAAAAPSSLPISQRLGQQWQLPAVGSGSRSIAQQEDAAATKPLSLLQLALLMETRPAPLKPPTSWQRHLGAVVLQQQQSQQPQNQQQQRPQPSPSRVTGGWYSEQLRGSRAQRQVQPGSIQVAAAQRQPPLRLQDGWAAHRQAHQQAEQHRAAASAPVGFPKFPAAAAALLFGRPIGAQDRRQAPAPAPHSGQRSTFPGSSTSAAMADAAHKQHGMALVPAQPAHKAAAAANGGIGGSFGTITYARGAGSGSSVGQNNFVAGVKPSTILLPPAHRCVSVSRWIHRCVSLSRWIHSA